MEEIFSPYKMTVNYEEEKIIIEYNKDFLHPHLLKHGERYISNLLELTKLIDWYIRKTFSDKKKLCQKKQE